MFAWLVFLLFSCSGGLVVAEQGFRVVSDDEETVTNPAYKISRFGILLEPTPNAITDDIVESLLSPVLEATLFHALGGEHTQSSYVLLAAAFVEGDRRRQLQQESNSTTTTIIVKGGLVNFRSQQPAEEVRQAIRDAIEENLVPNLPKNVAFEGVSNATYLSLNSTTHNDEPVVDVSPDSNANDSEEGEGEEPMSTPTTATTTLSASEIVFFVLASTGLLLLLIAVTLLALKIRKRRLLEQQFSSKILQDFSSDKQGSKKDPNQDDIDEEEEEEEEDIKRSHSQDNPYLFSQYLAAEETFERNTLMAVKKDMLQSEWSSTNHPCSPTIRSATKGDHRQTTTNQGIV
eukprot:scaffold19016_cov147-Cylindrotheca_fusiformis.AAC.3